MADKTSWTKEELDELANASGGPRGYYRNASACRSDSDGDCVWARCPQHTDRRQSHCPLDRAPYRTDEDED